MIVSNLSTSPSSPVEYFRSAERDPCVTSSSPTTDGGHILDSSGLGSLYEGDSILFFTWSLTSGGAERVAAVLASELSNRYSVQMGLLLPGKEKTYHVPDSVRVSERDENVSMPRFIRHLAKTVNPKVIIGIPDMSEIYVSGVMSKFPTIVSLRNAPANNKGRGTIKGLIRELIRLRCYAKAAAVIFQTEFSRDFYRKRTKMRCDYVIPNPIKPNLPYASRTSKRVITFCRLEPAKNLPLLIWAFKEFSDKHPDFRLDIYGDGRLRDALERLIEHEGLAGKAAIHHYSDNIHNEISDATMYVSSSNYEGMSNALLESMAMGLPSISTDSDGGGARSVIRNGENGLLVRKGDRKELASAMTYIADSPELAKKISDGGMRFAKDLSPQRVARIWEEAIDSALLGVQKK